MITRSKVIRLIQCISNYCPSVLPGILISGFTQQEYVTQRPATGLQALCTVDEMRSTCPPTIVASPHQNRVRPSVKGLPKPLCPNTDQSEFQPATDGWPPTQTDYLFYIGGNYVHQRHHRNTYNKNRSAQSVISKPG
jgi:hypothetical protein